LGTISPKGNHPGESVDSGLFCLCSCDWEQFNDALFSSPMYHHQISQTGITWGSVTSEEAILAYVFLHVASHKDSFECSVLHLPKMESSLDDLILTTEVTVNLNKQTLKKLFIFH
jgi:hypothetical protein